MNIYPTAKKYSESGLSVIPTNIDKASLIVWKPFQAERMTNGELTKNFKSPNIHGIAIICGPISGNLEVIDVDCKYDLTNNLWSDFQHLIEDNLSEIYEKLVIAKTVNSGYHIYYKCDEIEGNKKLACRPTLDSERTNKHDSTKVLIETRGIGGYVISPPTKGYEIIQGSLTKIPTITAEQRKRVLSIARSFNTEPMKKNLKKDIHSHSIKRSSFDDYNERADIIQILEKHGWKIINENDRYFLFRRPGKKGGISGTLSKNKRIFYVFSTSTQFESEKGYNPSQIYALLECDNDLSEASHRLYNEGFGERLQHLSKQKTDVYTEPGIALLPIDGMPDFIQHFIFEMTEIFGTPRDYWAGAVLMATALAIGDKFELNTKYQNNPILWGMFVGSVSNGKTEPLDLCFRYFRKHDANSIKLYQTNLNEFERVSKLNSKEREAEGIFEKPEKPECYQYLLSDTTPEAMADAHKTNSRGIMIYRDELKGWIDDFGRYSKSGEQSNMLTTWSQKGITYNRKTSGILNIDKPCILVAGGIQQELLHTLATDNRAENGFLARMVSFFPDNTKKQYYNNSIPNQDLINAWEEYIQSLTAIKSPKTLVLSDKSSELYEDWYNENVRKINSESIPYLKGAYGKLDIIVLRMAVILRGMNYQLKGIATPEILPEEMETAIQITEYFRETSKKVFKHIFKNSSSSKFDKKEIAVWLQKNTSLTKKQIAEEVLNSSRSQLDRLLNKISITI
ncbi:MAG: DUF3987 domain-containing protein [Bacteroidetes bacterium]|nr:DUF3987 domain-containing protein [Bacteroidota bacterium]